MSDQDADHRVFLVTRLGRAYMAKCRCGTVGAMRNSETAARSDLDQHIANPEPKPRRLPLAVKHVTPQRDYSENYHTIVMSVPIRVTLRKGTEAELGLELKHRAQDRLARTGMTVLEPTWEEA